MAQAPRDAPRGGQLREQGSELAHFKTAFAIFKETSMKAAADSAAQLERSRRWRLAPPLRRRRDPTLASRVASPRQCTTQVAKTMDGLLNDDPAPGWVPLLPRAAVGRQSRCVLLPA